MHHRWTETAAIRACLRLGGAWSKLSATDVSVRPLKGGMSNEMFICNSPGGKAVVVRFFGDQGDLVDKKTEMRIFGELARKNLGPKLLAVIPSSATHSLQSSEIDLLPNVLGLTVEDDDEPIGRVEEFLEGFQTFTVADYKNDAQLSAVAKLLGKWHCTQTESIPKVPRVFQDLANLTRQVRDHKGSEPERWERLLGRAVNVEAAARRVVEELEASYQGAEDLVFCHNDMQYGNVMQEANNGRHCLIDFEYCGYNPAYYELANWFCEQSADYSDHVAACGFTMDVSEKGFVTAAVQRRVVAQYLRSREDNGNGWGPQGVPEESVERFRERVLQFVPGSHLFWGLWGVLKAREEKQDDAPQYGDFDYSAYAAYRLQWVL